MAFCIGGVSNSASGVLQLQVVGVIDGAGSQDMP